ncbi:LysE family translocator [Chitinophaga japonensis]|uniref:Threonine/homoserine/homoserine lactone efflux protein n=1 Tax=Chitinophaga japonensis TaxID=104662 RepID=A0A562ST43_CHIJA|nr:LysE family translocator [Chitinophaga japonensis]TWI83966.1 threonine/homoserine/homoserine lactone efflux protein [Chitinophaga japonensis]
MFDLHTLLAFIGASLLLLVIPGPAVLYIIAKSAEQGRKAGMASVAGIETGTLVHVCASAIGISALLLASATAFAVLKYAGAFYLIWMGLKKVCTRQPVPLAAQERKQPSLRAIFWQGAIVNILNPKTALFFFAFLPQFVNPARGAVTLQLAVLGVIFVMLATITDSVFALAAGSLSDWLRRQPRYLVIQHYISGGIYIFLGLLTMLVQPSQKK